VVKGRANALKCEQKPQYKKTLIEGYHFSAENDRVKQPIMPEVFLPPSARSFVCYTGYLTVYFELFGFDSVDLKIGAIKSKKRRYEFDAV
jgi:hypothetical protein